MPRDITQSSTFILHGCNTKVMQWIRLFTYKYDSGVKAYSIFKEENLQKKMNTENMQKWSFIVSAKSKTNKYSINKCSKQPF